MPISENENKPEEVRRAEDKSEETKVSEVSIERVAPRPDKKENSPVKVRDKMPDRQEEADNERKDADLKLAKARKRKGQDDEVWSNLSVGDDDDRVAVLREKLGLAKSDSNVLDDETMAAFKRFERERGGVPFGVVTEEMFQELLDK